MSTRLLGALLTTLALAACSALGPRTFEFTFEPRPGGLEPLPALLTDLTGTVVGIEPPPDLAIGVMFDEGAAQAGPNRVVITWIGGACDRAVTLELGDAGGGLELFINTDREPGACRLVGIGRSLAIRFILPRDAATIRVNDS